MNSSDMIGWTPLMNASSFGNTEIINLLLDHGADVNQINKEEKTALMWAAMDGHSAAVRVLIKHGAIVDAADINGMTALF